MWTCQMLYSLHEYIDYRQQDSTEVPDFVDECEGLSTYIRDTLMGGSPDNRKGDHCFLSLAFRSDGSDHDLINDWCGIQSDQKLACDEQWSQEVNVPDCKGTPWYSWTPEWVEGMNCIAGAGTGTACDKPDTGCESANGRHHDFSIHLHAISMAFDGHVCDHIMYLARMALDYGRWLADQGRDAESLDAEAAADLISRYALRIMMERCRLYIHEIGHAWLAHSHQSVPYPGDHCKYNCCNDVAASHFCCWVRSYLGLPLPTYASGVLSDDYDPSSNRTERELDKCSHDINPVKGSRAYLVWQCNTRENGTAGLTPWKFCATGCLVGYFVDAEGNGNPVVFERKNDGEMFWGWDGFCA